MYPWYRDSVGQIGQFCAGNPMGMSSMSPGIKGEGPYADCMLAIDYATQNKVGNQHNFHKIAT